jgi:hypothetical protein
VFLSLSLLERRHNFHFPKFYLFISKAKSIYVMICYVETINTINKNTEAPTVAIKVRLFKK